MNSHINLVLADDDKDDCMLFGEIMDEFHLPVNLTVINDSEELMLHLTNQDAVLPHAVFLDLNMPKKNGFECLAEIKAHQDLGHLPVFIYSTSFDPERVEQLHQNGAHHYIMKPGEFPKLREVVHHALSRVAEGLTSPTDREQFILQTP